jgi:hypothetical protein
VFGPVCTGVKGPEAGRGVFDSQQLTQSHGQRSISVLTKGPKLVPRFGSFSVGNNGKTTRERERERREREEKEEEEEEDKSLNAMKSTCLLKDERGSDLIKETFLVDP